MLSTKRRQAYLLNELNDLRYPAPPVQVAAKPVPGNDEGHPGIRLSAREAVPEPGNAGCRV